jgi:hypothetical protein
VTLASAQQATSPASQQATSPASQQGSGRAASIGLGALPVTVVPPAGASVDAAGTDPAAAQVTLRLDRVALRLRAEPGDSLAGALQAQRSELQARPGFLRFTGEGDAVTDQGVPGRAGAFDSDRGSGSYAVFQVRGIAVRVDVQGERGALGPVAKSVAASIRSISIGAAA